MFCFLSFYVRPFRPRSAQASQAKRPSTLEDPPRARPAPAAFSPAWPNGLFLFPLRSTTKPAGFGQHSTFAPPVHISSSPTCLPSHACNSPTQGLLFLTKIHLGSSHHHAVLSMFPLSPCTNALAYKPPSLATLPLKKHDNCC